MFGKLKKNETNAKKRLAYNAFFSLVSWFLPLVLGFLATPIILRGLGYEEYGLFSLILGFISYSFTFGVGRAATKYVSEYRAQGQTAKISEIISATFWLSVLLGVFGVAAILVGSEIIVADVLQIKTEDHAAAINSLYLASATIAFLMIGQVFQAVVQAVHRFDRNSLLITLNGFLLTAGNVALVYAGFGLRALLIWNLLATMLNGALFYLSAKKFVPEFRLNFRFGGETIRLVSGYGAGVIGYQIFANILLLFERSWIIRRFGAESLSFYVVPMTLSFYFHGFINSLTLVVFPVFSELRGDREKLVSVYQKATKIVLAATVFAVLTSVCGGRMFLTLWISRDLAEKSFAVLIVHFASFGLVALMIIIWQLAEGFARPRFNAAMTFIWLVVSLPLMMIAADEWNILGVGLARLAGILTTIPLIFYGEKQFLGEIQTAFWAKNISIIAVAAFLSGAAESFLFNSGAESWLVFIFGAACGAAIFSLVLWLLNFITLEEKRLIRQSWQARY